MGMSIANVGVALPHYGAPQTESAQMAVDRCCHTDAQVRRLEVMFRRTQIDQRSSVLLEQPNGHGLAQSFFPPAENVHDGGPSTGKRMRRYASEAPKLALEAAQNAFKLTVIEPEQISHLVTVSCTGFVAPGVDVSLIRQLGLSSTVERTHIGFMGCHGALNGLRVAAAMTTADPNAIVLLCAVELCSLHFAYGWDPGKVVANALFADGAAAMIGQSTEKASGHAGWRLSSTAANLLPDSEDVMSWHVGDHGFEMTLSPRVPELIRQHLRPWLAGWLKTQGLGIKDVMSWAIHPGGPRILDSVLECLSLSYDSGEASREVLRQYGNMSSPTILFILDRLRQQDAPRPCVALGFGPGLAAEAALFV